MKALYIVLLVALTVSMYVVDSAYAHRVGYFDMIVDVFDYTQRALTPSEIDFLSENDIGDYRGFDIIVMDVRIEYKDDMTTYLAYSDYKPYGAGYFDSELTQLLFYDRGSFVQYHPFHGLFLDPSNTVSRAVVLLDSRCSESDRNYYRNVPTGDFLCFLVPSDLSPIAIAFRDAYKQKHGFTYHPGYAQHTVMMDSNFRDSFPNVAPYTLDIIQDVHIPILQSAIFLYEPQQLLLVFDRSVRINDINFVSISGANLTYVFESSDVISPLSGQVIRLDTMVNSPLAKYIHHNDVALVLQQDAFISTVDENNVYNSQQILPIIRIR